MLSTCAAAVGENGRELIAHGTTAFPIACYHDNLGAAEVPWHWHEEWEAVVISRGSALVKTECESYVVAEGEGFFINSGILHSCWDFEDSGCRFHSLVFHPRLVGGSIESIFYQEYVLPLLNTNRMESLCLRPDTLWQGEALRAIEEAWQACVKEPIGYEWSVRDALSRMIWRLHQNLPVVSTAPSAKAIRDGERMKQMLAYIDEHLSDELHTVKIAKSAAVSESECLRCFRSVINTTPIQYVRQLRIRRATQLLRDSNKSISDIAAECGFRDFSYFTKTFRDMERCTPTDYRRRYK